ncbi:hypothetical protein CDEF62S_01563 [Castellaniella defragrans]
MTASGSAIYDRKAGLLSFPYYADEYNSKPEPYRPLAGTLYARILQSGQPLLLPQDTVIVDEPGTHAGPVRFANWAFRSNRITAPSGCWC